jgi:hypothetical protein
VPAPLVVGGLCLVCGVLALLIPFVEYSTVHMLAAMMFLCWLVPLWYQRLRGRLDVFETLHVVGLLYFTYFGLGAVWTVLDPAHVAYDRYIPEFIPQATLYCLIGYLAWLAGYFGPWFRVRARAKPDERLHGVLFLAVPTVLGALGHAGQRRLQLEAADQTFSSLASALSQLEPMFYFAWGLAWVLQFSGRNTRGQRWFLFGLMVPLACLILMARVGNKTLSMMLPGLPIIALWYARRRIAWVPIVGMLLLLVFVVFPFYNTFRALMPYSSDTARASATVEVIRKWDAGEYADNTVVRFKMRMALINSVALLIRDVPRWVPYRSGAEQLISVLGWLTPRALWPDKPVFDQGLVFSRQFRVVNPMTRTYIATTIPGELYWTFDLPGIVFGMLVGGVWIRLLYRRYAGEGTALNPVRRAMHMVVLTQCAAYGGGLAAEFAMTLRTLLILEVLCWLGRRTGLVRPL